MKRFLFILIGFSLLVSGCGKKDKITYDPVDRKAHEQLIVDFYNYCLNNTDLTLCNNLGLENIEKIKVIEPLYQYNSYCYYGDYYCYNVVLKRVEKDGQIHYKSVTITIMDNKIVRRYISEDNKTPIEEHWPKS